jgi:ATP-dependent helicase HrpB
VTRYLRFAPAPPIEPRVADAVLRAIEEEQGDLLVFLPGQREIRRVEGLLADAGLPAGVLVQTLYSEAPPEQQRAALAPAKPAARKVILSTSIAETSLTIDGVRIVVDAGLARGPQFDPRRGMTGLVTTRVSMASADQRRGRAGRQGPGVCYRLWTEEQHAALSRFLTPEILAADLAPLALDLAQWGVPEGEGLRFLDPPPRAHLAQASSLLKSLGALDERGVLTDHGRAMAGLPVHPRLAHMVIRGVELGLGSMACEVAALLEERDLLRGGDRTDVDLFSRWHAVRSGAGADRAVRERVLAETKRLREIAGIVDARVEEDRLGLLLATAYPDRLARRRGKEGGRYQMVKGTGAVLPEWSLLAREEFLAVGEVDGIGTEVRIFLASPIEKSDLLEVFSDQIVAHDEVTWSPGDEAVVARRVQRLDTLVITEQVIAPHVDAQSAAMLQGVIQMGLGCLPWDRATASFRERSEWLRSRHLVADDWPDLSDAHLLDTLPDWLGPYLSGINRRSHLTRLNLHAVLQGLFSHRQVRDLERLAPETLTVPTGSRIRVEYATGSTPVLAVRLQEMLGQRDTPTIAGGRVNVMIHLLSPAGRPLAVTQDLSSFWQNAYPEVRKQMRGRYPRHIWPEDPLNAEPTRRTRR